MEMHISDVLCCAKKLLCQKTDYMAISYKLALQHNNYFVYTSRKYLTTNIKGF